MRGQRVDEKICLMVDSEVAGGGWIGRGGAAVAHAPGWPARFDLL